MKINNNPEDPRITAGKNISYWTDSVSSESENPLKENLETEVVIIGGGLAGLSVAYCLSQSGKKVVLVEDGFIGSGETGRTTAHLVPQAAKDLLIIHSNCVFRRIIIKLFLPSLVLLK